MPPTLIELLGRELPADRLVIDPDVLASLSTMRLSGRRSAGQLWACGRAREAEISHAVRVCAELSVPVVTRGAGTGLSGGANAVDGCLVLDVSRMDADHRDRPR